MKHSTKTEVLKNGINILFINIPGVKTFDFAIAFRSGYRFSNKDNADQYEIPHVLEHMVFDGSESYRDSDALHAIFKQGGGEFNGMTSPYHNVFPFHSRIAHAQDVLSAALNAVYFPLLKESSFSEEVEVIREELGEYLRDIPYAAGQYSFRQATPTMSTSADVQLERLPNVTLDAVKNYHKKYFSTKNTSMVIATDFKQISKEKIIALILDATKNVPIGKEHDFPVLSVEPSSEKVEFVPLHRSIDESTASVHYLADVEPAEKDMVALGIFCAIAGGMRSHSVNHILRKRGLTYGLQLAPVRTKETFGLELSITAGNDKFIELFANTIELLRNFINDGIDAKEFERAKQEVIDGLDDGESSADALISWYLEDYLMTKTINNVREYRKIMDSVDQQFMLGVAKRVFNRKKMYTVVFSAKGRRAGGAMSALSNAILENGEKLTSELIASNSLPIGDGDKTLKRLYGLLLSVGFVVFIMPLFGNYEPTMTTSLRDMLGFVFIVPIAHVILLLVNLTILHGKELRTTLLIYSSAIVFLLLLVLDTIMPYLMSKNILVATQAWIVIASTLVMLGVSLFSYVKFLKK